VTAKEFLQSVRQARGSIGPEIERLEELRERAGYGTGRKEATRISGTPQRSRVEDNICALVDYEAKLNKERVQTEKPDMLDYAWRRAQAIDIIKRIPRQQYAEVLYLYYLEGLSWGEVASVIKRSIRHTHRLHGWALVIFERLWLDMSLENS
jgi:hypothetical protein